MRPDSRSRVLRRAPRWLAVLLPLLALAGSLLARDAGSWRLIAAPRPLPAQLDPVYLADLDELAARIPADGLVAISVGPQRRTISSWYWTMAAFTHPQQRWVREGEPAAAEASWRLAPSGLEPRSPWRPVACAGAWCLWRR